MKLEFDSLEEVFDFVDRVRYETGEEKIPDTLTTYRKDQTRLALDLEQIHKNNKIAAIKVFRAITGEGLKESKDAIDSVWKP